MAGAGRSGVGRDRGLGSVRASQRGPCPWGRWLCCIRRPLPDSDRDHSELIRLFSKQLLVVEARIRSLAEFVLFASTLLAPGVTHSSWKTPSEQRAGETALHG